MMAAAATLRSGVPAGRPASWRPSSTSVTTFRISIQSSHNHSLIANFKRYCKAPLPQDCLVRLCGAAGGIGQTPNGAGQPPGEPVALSFSGGGGRPGPGGGGARGQTAQAAPAARVLLQVELG